MRKTLLLAATALAPQLAHAANTDLIDPLESETFTAIAATATHKLNTATKAVTSSSSTGALAVAYNATT